MMDSKTLLLTVLLLSQLAAHAGENAPAPENIDKKYVDAVISEEELKFLMQKKILTPNEDGTFSVNKEVLKQAKKQGFDIEGSKAATICVKE